MFGPCSVIERETQQVLSVRLRTPVQELPELIGREYQKIFHYLSELGEMQSGAPFVGYFNMDMSDLDVEIGFPVSKELPGYGEIASGSIPAGRYATMIFTGPYGELKLAYRELAEWIQQNQWRPGNLAYEFYLNDPAVVPEDELQTQILISVE